MPISYKELLSYSKSFSTALWKFLSTWVENSMAFWMLVKHWHSILVLSFWRNSCFCLIFYLLWLLPRQSWLNLKFLVCSSAFKKIKINFLEYLIEIYTFSKRSLLFQWLSSLISARGTFSFHIRVVSHDIVTTKPNQFQYQALSPSIFRSWSK